MSTFRVGQVVIDRDGQTGVVLSERAVLMRDWAYAALSPHILVAYGPAVSRWVRLEALRSYDGP